MHVEEPEDQELEFQIAPMVDVVFMLIIFFMLSAAVKSTEFEMGMTLPGTGTPQKGTPLTPIELAIKEDGTVLYNDLEVGKPEDTKMEELQTRLEKAVKLFGGPTGDQQPVIIAPKPSVPHSRIVDVMNVCAAAKVTSLSFAGS